MSTVFRLKPATYVQLNQVGAVCIQDNGTWTFVKSIPPEALPQDSGNDNTGTTPTNVRTMIALAAEISKQHNQLEQNGSKE